MHSSELHLVTLSIELPLITQSNDDTWEHAFFLIQPYSHITCSKDFSISQVYLLSMKLVAYLIIGSD